MEEKELRRVTWRSQYAPYRYGVTHLIDEAGGDLLRGSQVLCGELIDPHAAPRYDTPSITDDCRRCRKIAHLRYPDVTIRLPPLPRPPAPSAEERRKQWTISEPARTIRIPPRPGECQGTGLVIASPHNDNDFPRSVFFKCPYCETVRPRALFKVTADVPVGQRRLNRKGTAYVTVWESRIARHKPTKKRIVHHGNYTLRWWELNTEAGVWELCGPGALSSVQPG